MAMASSATEYALLPDTPGFTDKQFELVSKLGQKRHTFATGPWRSGKSHACVKGLASYSYLHFDNQEIALLFKTWRQLKAIARKELRAWTKDFCFIEDDDFNLRGDEWRLPNQFGGYNTFWPVPYVDSDQAVERIQGFSLAAFMVDEGVNLHEQTRNMLISRLSETDERAALWTSNPDAEDHEFKLFLDNVIAKDRGQHFTFSLYDNPNMDEELIEDLKLACPLDWQYRRYILGEWCGPAGNVWPSLTVPYPNGAIRKIGDEPILSMAAGVDFGARTVTAAIFVAITTEGLWVVDEWYHDGRERGMLSERAQVEQMVSYARSKGYSIADWVVDKTATALYEEFYHQGVRAIKSDCGVTESIENIARGCNVNRIWVDPYNTPKFRKEVVKYGPKEHATETYGDIKPDKKAAYGAHIVDGFRYVCWKLRKLL